jgi:hypothetical protein
MNDSPEPRNGGISTHERLEVVGATAIAIIAIVAAAVIVITLLALSGRGAAHEPTLALCGHPLEDPTNQFTDRDYCAL